MAVETTGCRATLRFARNDGSAEGDCDGGQQVAALHCVPLAMTAVGTIAMGTTGCRAALRFARNDDCDGDNRLPHCTAFRSQ